MKHSTNRWWKKPINLGLVGFVIIGAYFLLMEHRAHIIEALPWILVLGCLFMHLFMHRGHGKHSNDGGDSEQ